MQRAVGDVGKRRHAIGIAVFPLAGANPDAGALAYAWRQNRHDRLRRRPCTDWRHFRQSDDLS
jgi:hypothetical protein